MAGWRFAASSEAQEPAAPASLCLSYESSMFLVYPFSPLSTLILAPDLPVQNRNFHKDT